MDDITQGISGLSGAPQQQVNVSQTPPQDLPAGVTPVADQPAPAPAPGPTSMMNSPTAQAVGNIPQQQPAGPTPKPNTPHAGLLNIVQNIALGLDSMGKSIATGGREGGVQEVLQARAGQQDANLKQQANQRAQQDHDLQMKLGTADYNMKTAQLAHMIADAPLDRQKLYTAVQNQTLDLLLKKGVVLGKAVDMIDGQSPDAHYSGVNEAANGDFTKNRAIPTYGPDGAGKGGGKTVVVSDASTSGIRYNVDDLNPSLNLLQNTIDNGKQEVGEKSQGVIVAQGQLDSARKGLNAGGTISHRDWLGLQQAVQLGVEQPVAQKEKLLAFQKMQADAAKAQNDAANSGIPKNPDEAQGRATAAAQAYQANPTPATKQALDNANQQLQNISQFTVRLAQAKSAAESQGKAPEKMADRQAAQQVEMTKKAATDATKSDMEFNDVLSKANNIKTSILAAKDGNQLAASVAPLQTTLFITTAEGVKRVNETELHSVAGAGSVAQRLNGFFSKAAVGDPIPDKIKNDMISLMDLYTASAQQKYQRELQVINARHGTNFTPVLNGVSGANQKPFDPSKLPDAQ